MKYLSLVTAMLTAVLLSACATRPPMTPELAKKHCDQAEAYFHSFQSCMNGDLTPFLQVGDNLTGEQIAIIKLRDCAGDLNPLEDATMECFRAKGQIHKGPEISTWRAIKMSRQRREIIERGLTMAVAAKANKLKAKKK